MCDEIIQNFGKKKIAFPQDFQEFKPFTELIAELLFDFDKLNKIKADIEQINFNLRRINRALVVSQDHQKLAFIEKHQKNFINYIDSGKAHMENIKKKNKATFENKYLALTQKGEVFLEEILKSDLIYQDAIYSFQSLFDNHLASVNALLEKYEVSVKKLKMDYSHLQDYQEAMKVRF